jgi:hypothetical protein
MAVMRGTAFKFNASPGRCWTYELAWDDDQGLDDSGRVLAWCDQPPVGVLYGFGICAVHRPLFCKGRWSMN